jgi:5-methylcytosine-specific restriction endonuclease McrA
VTAPKRRKVAAGVRRAVYIRDQWTCQYCGLRIDPQEPNQANGKNAPAVFLDGDLIWLELDHAVPHSLGGADTVDNFRSACTPCNKLKRDSTQATGWDLRTARAIEILSTEPPSRANVQAAARALLGVNVFIDENGRVRFP